MEWALRILGGSTGFAIIMGVFMFLFPSCMDGCSSPPDLTCHDSVYSFQLKGDYTRTYDCTSGAEATWEKVEQDNKTMVIVTCTCDPNYVPPATEIVVTPSE